ncbi:Acyl-CoA synthetase (AMP-forming)/AMP-acid ligase II [Agrococcus baldri]|uniref:Acyl-CoA synthetase (AMP-forming)/AMP-acid ligase II n=1 Tax=Agrococcus baldri TaxID=153730 RepID=A0AA94HMQ5_9MICO|nr:alpha/beta fold hydrolase [Agrococcus baldri]SFS11481.1 Acyl-CoA synthetase (AMP-forming)/AMP-acid ligase II [Agrococcus baldri]
MTAGAARPTTGAASLPPRDLPGLDPSWSRLVDVPGVGIDAGHARQWHCLDTADALARAGVPVTSGGLAGTILAVHGNPTWSYLWRSIAAESVRAAEAGEPAWRVVAVDQLEMGYSERTGLHRTLPQRVADLAAFTDALQLEGPVVTLGHDWGGVISLGWAIDHPEQLAAVALLNTAVHHPAGVPIPAPLRLAGARGVLAASTVATTAFLDTTLALASPALAPDVKAAFRAPYGSADRRGGIGNFVADIPVDERHESFPELERIAAGVAALGAATNSAAANSAAADPVPALMLWGPSDPVFGDRYLDDLADRLPHADIHRFEGASHLVAEDRPCAPAVLNWLKESVGRVGAEGAVSRPPTDPTFTPLWRPLESRAATPATADATAVIDMATGRGRSPRRVTWRQLDARVRDIAAGLHAMGVRKGDRVSLLVKPGPTLTAVLYACLKIGAIVVVADAGLGVKGLTRAVRGSWPDLIIGERLGLAAARALGWPGTRISAERLPKAAALALGVTRSTRDVADLGAGQPLPAEPGPADDAAILFTSGSTGPAKGVVYTHGQLSALRDVLGTHLGITADTGLVTGFAPFALLGPALGTLSATPDMDVSAPRTLTATAVAAAVTASDAGIVFLSPAAILNVVETADALTHDDRAALARVHTFLSTGAPIGEPMLRAVARLMPNATPHTPYGMTECLLVADITLAGVSDAAAAPDTGVCVGTPIGDNQVLVSALDSDGDATGTPSPEPGVLGEIVVSAPHLKSHYDRLHLTDVAATRDTPAGRVGAAGAVSRPEPQRWHRTGDIGHLDAQGRLWIEGRIQHVIVTADGPLAPVGPEQQVESADAVRRAAVVGVGPHGLRQAVAVVETTPAARRPGLADPQLTAAVRATTELPLAAVLVVPQLPTDVRHNSKIDRSRLSEWADRMLAGAKPSAP